MQVLAGQDRVAQVVGPLRVLRAEGIQDAGGDAVDDALVDDVAAVENALRLSQRVGDRRVVVPAGQRALEAGQQAVGDAGIEVVAPAGLERPPGDVERLAAQAGEGRHDAVARIEGTVAGHGHADSRQRRRRDLGFVGAAAVHEFQAGRVRAELLVEPGHGAELARLGDVVDEAGVVEGAQGLARQRHRVGRLAGRGIGVAGHAVVGKEVGGEGGAADLEHAALGPDPGAGEAAVGCAQRALLVPVDHAPHAESVAFEVAPAAGQVQALLVAAALGIGFIGLDHQRRPFHRALGDEVDHAADGVGAVDRRGAVAQHLDPLQRGHRDDVEVDRIGEIRVVRQPPPVEEHQGLVAAQAAQVGGGAAAGAGTDRRRRAFRRLVHGDCVQHFLRRGQALLGEVGCADRRDRQRGLGGQAPDRGAGDLDALHRRRRRGRLQGRGRGLGQQGRRA